MTVRMIKEVLELSVGIGVGLAAARCLIHATQPEKRKREKNPDIWSHSGPGGDDDETLADVLFRHLDNMVYAVVAVVAPQPPPPPPPDPPNPHF